VREVLQHVYSSTPDATDAEARFAVLSGIVKRLAGEAPKDKRWRQRVGTKRAVAADGSGDSANPPAPLTTAGAKGNGLQMIAGTVHTQ